ncbi:MAG: amidase family protein [Meiothermus sp.]|nr:amidase family protein [Meiothermus sp.]
MSQSSEPRKPNWFNRDWEAYIARQVEEQTKAHDYPLRRTLDFGPFEAALATLEPAELERLEGLTQSSTIAELGAEMAAGRLTSERLTLFYLWRIRRYNDAFRAYLELNPGALEQARALDQERSQGRTRGPLHGIPISLKDNIAALGMHNTAGAEVLRDHRPRQDSPIAARLRAAGAVILGKNNLSEWANFMTSASVNGYSTLGGHTRNPYGPFDVGGSSSGTAAAVAANLAVAGIGSETSGSLVYPAAQNSLFTLKPTLGLVSRSRVIPITAAQDTAGPMTKHAADMAVLMSVVTGHDPADRDTQIAQGFDFPHSPPPTPHPLRVGWIQHGIREGDEAALRGVAEALQGLGHEVVELELPQPEIEMLPVLHAGMRRDLAAYLSTAEAGISGLSEVIEFNKAHPAAMAYGQDLLETSLAHPLSDHELDALIEKNRRVGAEALLKLMGDHRVTVLLTVSNALSTPTSTSGFPVVNFPAGYRASGEPIGASIVAGALEDARLIGLAAEVSARLKARKPPALR